MVFASAAEFSAVKTKDCDGKDELQKAQGQVGYDQRHGLAAGDSGGWFLVETRESHCAGVMVVVCKVKSCVKPAAIRRMSFDWNGGPR